MPALRTGEPTRVLFARLQVVATSAERLNVARFIPAAVRECHAVINPDQVGGMDGAAVNAASGARTVDCSAKSTASRLGAGTASATSPTAEARCQVR